MITLSRLVNPQGSMAITGGFGVGYGYQHELRVGKILISPEPDVLDPARRTWDIRPKGVFHQGKQLRGWLHDKDVFHVTGRGHITIDPRLSRPYELLVPDDPNPVWGAFLQDGEGRLELISGAFYWGLDSSVSVSWEVLSEYHTFTDRHVLSHARTVEYEITFAGIYATVMLRISPYKTYALEESEPTLYPEEQYLQYLINDGEGTILGTAWFPTSLEGGERMVVTPFGTFKSQSMVGDLRRLGVTYSDLAVFTPDATLTEEDTEAIARTIHARLVSESFWAQIASTFNMYPEVIDRFGELGHDVQDQMRFVDRELLLTALDLAFGKGLGTLGKLPKLLTDLVADGFSSRVIAQALLRCQSWDKFAADLGLTISYADLPLIGDAQAVVRALIKFCEGFYAYTRLHSRQTSEVTGPRFTPINSTFTLTVETDSLPSGYWGDQMKMISALKRLGVYPGTFTGIWDIVPFSFIADWFLGIGHFLDGLQDSLDQDTQYFPIHYCILSTKRRWSPPLHVVMPGLLAGGPSSVDPWTVLPCTPGVSGHVTFSSYDRYMLNEMPLSVPDLEVGSGLSLTRLTQALFLTVQRK